MTSSAQLPAGAGAVAQDNPTFWQAARSKAGVLLGRGGPRSVEVLRAEAFGRLVDLLTLKGHGCPLRGWRAELDPDGDLEATAAEVRSGAVRLGFQDDVEFLLGESSTDGSETSLTLEQLMPTAAALIYDFKKWIHHRFNGSGQGGIPSTSHVEFFRTCDEARTGRIGRDEFIDVCTENRSGFSDEDLHLFYDCCDFCQVGYIRCEDLVFLELSPTTRQAERQKVQMGQMWRWRQTVAQEYLDCVTTSPHGQGAARAEHQVVRSPSAQTRTHFQPGAWQGSIFETMPAVSRQRRYARNRAKVRACQEARAVFSQHLLDTYGHEVRALRAPGPGSLDPDCRFGFNQSTLRRYLRRHLLDINSTDCWKALDKDGDGWVSMEELSPTRARVLSLFLTWAQQKFGSCAALWDTKDAERVRKRAAETTAKTVWASDKKMRGASVLELLRILRCPVTGDSDSRALLLSSLDCFGCGLVMRTDLEWLDKWRPPEWVGAQPDAEAWADLRALLATSYGHPLRAWRALFDVDNTLAVPWRDFRSACGRAKYKGNVAGIFNLLATKESAVVTLQTYDPESHRIVTSFKDWADRHYGSVKLCFDSLDTDRNGKVSLRELRRACRARRWDGDCALLFECLDVDGRQSSDGGLGNGRLELKEIVFLDDWFDDTLDDAAVVQPTASASVADSPESPAVNGVTPDSTMEDATEELKSANVEMDSVERPLIEDVGTVTADENTGDLHGAEARALSKEGEDGAWTPPMSEPMSPGIKSRPCNCQIRSCSPLRQGHLHNMPDELLSPQQAPKPTDVIRRGPEAMKEFVASLLRGDNAFGGGVPKSGGTSRARTRPSSAASCYLAKSGSLPKILSRPASGISRASKLSRSCGALSTTAKSSDIHDLSFSRTISSVAASSVGSNEPSRQRSTAASAPRRRAPYTVEA
eukprot:TRINITY_DN20672_c0_g1_i1.p1 TRINITY_DN20672_c0_g1~~TRINITY_DN20672_c0_g1_i1.p1  ORF type:complete len:927 (-),score=159.20 TRINITY_DN20672_c0_g1_i1:199-2979(-)